MTPPVALTVAGSDSGGAAGIQADLKTFAMHGVLGTSAITVLTAQNTERVAAMLRVDPAFVRAQIDAVLADLPVRAVKTGMLGSADTVALVGEYAPKLPNLVVDPVLVSSTGARLFDERTEKAYAQWLFPYATVITPNLDEAGLLVGRRPSTPEDMASAAEELAATGAGCVVLKGGRLRGHDEAIDVVWHAGQPQLLRTPWVETRNNHGTGCTLAAAIAARLALGDDVLTAVQAAKAYVQRAVEAAAGWRLGAGHGPLAWPSPPDR